MLPVSGRVCLGGESHPWAVTDVPIRNRLCVFPVISLVAAGAAKSWRAAVGTVTRTGPGWKCRGAPGDATAGMGVSV